MLQLAESASLPSRSWRSNPLHNVLTQDTFIIKRGRSGIVQPTRLTPAIYEIPCQRFRPLHPAGAGGFDRSGVYEAHFSSVSAPIGIRSGNMLARPDIFRPAMEHTKYIWPSTRKITMCRWNVLFRLYIMISQVFGVCCCLSDQPVQAPKYRRIQNTPVDKILWRRRNSQNIGYWVTVPRLVACN